MIRIINARSVDGTFFQCSMENGRFVDVARQSGPIAPVGSPSVTPLLQWVKSGKGDWDGEAILDAEGLRIVPGAIDGHVHSRDPGLTHKEDWSTLARGAYRGGVVAVADMPNTIPPMMTREATVEKAKIAAESGLDFRLFLGVGAANIHQVAPLLQDPSLPLCGLKVFYGRTTGELMYDDLETLARSLPAEGSKIIVFHSEDQCCVDRNQALYADQLDRTDQGAFAVHSLVRSSEAAHASTRKILEWGRISYKRPIHIAHISTPLEVELVSEAKSQGVSVTCEVAPHHLLFSTDDYQTLGPLVKMNPPLRSPAEVEKLRAQVAQGLVDIFATDHAPHLLSEKRTTVGRSPSGVPSVELFYPLVMEVVRRTGLSLQRAVDMSSREPARLFGFTGRGSIEAGARADFVLLSDGPMLVRGADVVSRCGWTPYDGWTLPCGVVATWADGRLVHADLEVSVR